jgi:predicted alpha/beta-hydrolase family hydrolase
MKTVDEIDALCLCSSDQTKQLTPLRIGVGPSPKFSVIGIILGRIEIGIHAARRAEFQQPSSMRHRPQRTEKAFDNAAALKSFSGVHAALISHGKSAGTRIQSRTILGFESSESTQMLLGFSSFGRNQA